MPIGFDVKKKEVEKNTNTEKDTKMTILMERKSTAHKQMKDAYLNVLVTCSDLASKDILHEH